MIDWINLYKGILICLVFLGHSSLASESVLKIIYSFHMPAFFIISGFLYKKNRNSYMFIKKKIVRLLVPYLSYSLLFFLIWFVIKYPFNLSEYFINVFLGRNELLWFLICLFLVFMIYYCIDRFIVKDVNKVIVVVFCFLVGDFLSISGYNLPFYFSSSLCALLFFYVGIVLNKGKFQVDNFRMLKKIIILVFCLGIVLYLPGNLDMRTASFYPSLVRIPIAIILSLLVMSLCRYIKKIPILNYVGINSLDFFAVGTFVPLTIDFIFQGANGMFTKIISIVVIVIFVFLKKKTKLYIQGVLYGNKK